MIVGSHAQALALVAKAIGLVRSRLVLGMAQDNLDALREVQRKWWDRRFDVGLVHHPDTVQARAAALAGPRVRRRSVLSGSYYRKNRPRGATSDNPYAYWTGALMRSTSVFTAKGPSRAEIDCAKSYRGPIQGLTDPVKTIVVRRGADPFDRPGIARVLDAYAAKKVTEYLETAT